MFNISDMWFSSTAVAKSVCTPWPLSAKEHSGPKTRFGAQNPHFVYKTHFWSPKVHLWGYFAPWLKRLIKQMVWELLFRTFEARMPKWVPLSNFERQNAKKGSFCIFGAKSAKMSSFPVFGSQSAQRGFWNHSFGKGTRIWFSVSRPGPGWESIHSFIVK